MQNQHQNQTTQKTKRGNYRMMNTVKVKLQDLHPNPFKQEISGGKLNEEQVSKLEEGMRQTTFHENLLARKRKEGGYELVYGHHRLESAKRVFGINYQISLKTVDYSDEQMIIDLCRENLTQRSNEFRQELDSVLLVKKWLEKNKPTVQQVDSRRNEKGQLIGSNPSGVGARQVATFLSKEGKTISKSKVADLLNMKSNLNKKILDQVTKKNTQETEGVSYKTAIALTRIEDKNEQKQLADAISKSQEERGGRPHEHLSDYKKAPDNVKQKVLQGEIDIQDLEIELGVEEAKQTQKQGKKEDDPKIQVTYAIEIVQQYRHELNKLMKEAGQALYKVKQWKKLSYKWFDKRSSKDMNQLLTSTKRTIISLLEEVEKLEEQFGGR